MYNFVFCVSFRKKNLTNDDVNKIQIDLKMAIDLLKETSEIIETNLSARRDLVAEYKSEVKIGRQGPPKSILNYESLPIDELLDKFVCACNQLRGRFIDLAS